MSRTGLSATVIAHLLKKPIEWLLIFALLIFFGWLLIVETPKLVAVVRAGYEANQANFKSNLQLVITAFENEQSRSDKRSQADREQHQRDMDELLRALRQNRAGFRPDGPPIVNNDPPRNVPL